MSKALFAAAPSDAAASDASDASDAVNALLLSPPLRQVPASPKHVGGGRDEDGATGMDSEENLLAVWVRCAAAAEAEATAAAGASTLEAAAVAAAAEAGRRRAVMVDALAGGGVTPVAFPEQLLALC